MYERNTDEENIRLIRDENDNAAFEYMIKKYMGMAWMPLIECIPGNDTCTPHKPC